MARHRTVAFHSVGAVIEVLERIRRNRPLPEVIVTDNGSEVTSPAFDSRAQARGVKIDYIQPGTPIQNCFIQDFNGTFRDDCLNLHWFVSLERARVGIEGRRLEHNRIRPHSFPRRADPRSVCGISQRWRRGRRLRHIAECQGLA